MAQSITIRIENSSEHDSGGVVGASSIGGVPSPIVSGMGSSADRSAMAAPTPLDDGGHVTQADMAAPSPSTDFFPNASAGTADIPTPFSGGAAFGSATTAPMPTDAMLPGASDDQTSIPSPEMMPDAVESGEYKSEAGKSGPDEGASRKAKK